MVLFGEIPKQNKWGLGLVGGGVGGGGGGGAVFLIIFFGWFLVHSSVIYNRNCEFGRDLS